MYSIIQHHTQRPYMHMEGIILSSIRYKDYDQIATVFSREEGVIQLLIKRAYAKSAGYGSKTALFVRAEHIYAKGRGDFYFSQEISPLNYHLEFRNCEIRLKAAVEIAKAILQTQMPMKRSPELYDLFAFYLKALTMFPLPMRLVASFRLKLLRHEGFFGVAPYCSICRQELQEHHLFQGESFCLHHAPVNGMLLAVEESAAFYTLAFSRSLAEIEDLEYEPILEDKILNFYKECILQ